MSLSVEDARLLLSKYVSEQTPLLATLVTTAAMVRVFGTLRAGPIDGVPHLFVGVTDKNSDFIQFNLLNCEFSYGDLREAKQGSADSVAHMIEGILCVTSRPSGNVLTLFERKDVS